MKNFIILTGPPGSGKTVVLNQLNNLGYKIVSEPARSILYEQRSIDGDGTYDKNSYLFKELMLSRMMHSYIKQSNQNELIFFDRALPDMIAYSRCFNLPIGAEIIAAQKYRYNVQVMFFPAWEDIYENDNERKMHFNESLIFERDLKEIYKELNYEVVLVPKISINKRIEFILKKLKQA